MSPVASPATPLPITVIILAFNEEIHIERCLQRLVGWVERMVVIDSFSTDRTVEIARSLGAQVLQHPWKNHADQFRWGLEAAAPHLGVQVGGPARPRGLARRAVHRRRTLAPN